MNKKRPQAARKSKGARETEKQKLLRILKRHIRANGSEYLKDSNITSVGVGLKNGDGPISLQFTVSTKGDSAIESLGSRRIPALIEIDGETIPTDVIERRYLPSYTTVEDTGNRFRTSRHQRMVPGISVAHYEGSAGTIGLIVFDKGTGAPCILSNWHVLHTAAGEIGDVTVQPGPHDKNDIAHNHCGELLRSHLGDAGDCALSRIRARDYRQEIHDLGVRPRQVVDPELGDTVMKSGRTTRVTHGIVRRVHVMASLDYPEPMGRKAIGCFEIGVDPDREPASGEISQGGDSGAAWVISNSGKPTDLFAGLHFAGEGSMNPDEHALVCYASSVRHKLDFSLEPPGAASRSTDDPEAIPRKGYDPSFLGFTVEMPTLSHRLKIDAENFGDQQTIPYTHFSVCLSRKRKLARFVAWNIDGANRVVTRRQGFEFDPRVDRKFQTGNDLYRSNELDRGHLARRADLSWGSIAEARQANSDSFYYTNIAPQHAAFNQSSRQGLWGELENLVLEQVNDQELKVSVFAGPIFKDDDQLYRNVQIPTQYWKLIVFRGQKGQPSCAAFVLAQTELLVDLERINFDPFRIFQVAVDDLSTHTELGFLALKRWDVLADSEITQERKRTTLKNETRTIEIKTRDDILL